MRELDQALLGCLLCTIEQGQMPLLRGIQVLSCAFRAAENGVRRITQTQRLASLRMSLKVSPNSINPETSSIEFYYFHHRQEQRKGVPIISRKALQ